MTVIAKSTKFEFVSYTRPDSRAFNINDESSELSDRDYFQEAMTGHTVISEPVKSRLRGANIIAVASPLRRGEAIDGVLVGTLMWRN